MIKKFLKICLVTIILIFISSAISVFAATTADTTYIPLEKNAFSGMTSAASGDLIPFLSDVFNFGIAVAVALALIMIIWGGIEYMTSDAWQNKDNGKKRIQDALWGLGLALVSYLILFTINPCLVVFTNKDGCTANTFLTQP